MTDFTCLGAAYAIRHACLARNWRALRGEMDLAAKYGATVIAQVDAKGILIRVRRANSDGVDYINDLHFRDVIQIVESLRECGATIEEKTE